MTPNPYDVLKHFGLSHNPFGKIQGEPDLYPSLEQRNFANLVRYAVAHNEMVALVGDWGTGKTTLLGSVRAALDDDVIEIAVQADKATLTVGSIEEACLRALGHDNPPQAGNARRNLLHKGWIDLYESGRKALLILDEAHRVPGGTMKSLKELHEQSRHAWHETLFAVLLVGHRQLPAGLAWTARDVLARLEAQNILYLARMIPQQAAHYIRHRLEAAGGAGLIPDEEALLLIARRATPLDLNRIMWTLLTAACLAGEKTITRERALTLLPDRSERQGAEGAALDDVLKRFSTGGRDAQDEKERAAG